MHFFELEPELKKKLFFKTKTHLWWGVVVCDVSNGEAETGGSLDSQHYINPLGSPRPVTDPLSKNKVGRTGGGSTEVDL